MTQHNRPKTVSMRVDEALLAMTGDSAKILKHSKRDWASITFSGHVHTISMEFNQIDAMEASSLFEASLPSHEFDIPDFLVADAGVPVSEHFFIGDEIKVIMTAELLLLKDD